MGKIQDNPRLAATELPKSATILIVDNQRFERACLLRMIDHLEFETHVVQVDSLEAMGAKLTSEVFDLIFIDYNLPDGTGLQALDAVHRDPVNRHAATIMIAGDGQDDIAIGALHRGCSDFIARDDLSPSSFTRAAINALQKSRLAIGVERQETKRKEFEAMLAKLSAESANEIQPVLSRIIRQIKELRDATDLPPERLSDRCDRMERSCMKLRDFLNVVSRCQVPEEPQDMGLPTKNTSAPQGDSRAHSTADGAPVKPRRIQASRDVASQEKAVKKPAKPSIFGKFRK